jgi:MFS family permease
MPNRLGLYNVMWALGDGIGFAASGWLFSWRPDSIVWVAGGIHLLQWLWLKFAPRNRGEGGQTAMRLAHSGDDIPRPIKRRFMHTAWLGNALGFLMLSGFAALTPFVGQRLGLEPRYTIWLASTLLFARAAAFFVFWKWEGWHYNRGWLKTAMWLGPATLAVVFFVQQPVLVFGALIVFGITLGLAYSASIYYSLDYGEQKGEHGGIHESILGIGILVGSLLAALVSGLGGGPVGAELTILLLAVGATGIGRQLIERSLKTSS